MSAGEIQHDKQQRTDNSQWNVQLWLAQTQCTVSLPDFTALLSAEGDFVVEAGSGHVTHLQHNTCNDITRPREEGTGRGHRDSRGQGEVKMESGSLKVQCERNNETHSHIYVT